jgi:ACR3 family arsenite efflux pump ArsB
MPLLDILFVGILGQSFLAVDVNYQIVTTGVGVFLGIPLAAVIITRSIRNLRAYVVDDAWTCVKL